ncbi:TRM11 family SAM-dependent methyltransferase [Virgibacillus tibetensis]|uniref:TRM11 family SAM-dependent methyltransferase n=1 Tax=Virgibacillus tibetensis TaxID=3042313 RepID=UPI002E18E82E
MANHELISEYIYTYRYPEEEHSLCQLEMRAFFNTDTDSNFIKSKVKVDPSRSPFMKDRIEVMYEGNSLSEIMEQVTKLRLGESTFSVSFINFKEMGNSKKISYKERNQIERDLGWKIDADFDLHHPDYAFGLIRLNDYWYFGEHVESEPVWLHHVKKPHSYSTALGTRLARSLCNIAVPDPEGISVIDPCCGIGNVLVEALSMQINISGRDINPLVTKGSRKNIAHFGYECDVTTGPIETSPEGYDVAIIDLPYNLYTHITQEEQLSILKHANRIADKVVVVTVDTIDHMVEEAGFQVKDRCIARKARFSRQVLVCE